MNQSEKPSGNQDRNEKLNLEGGEVTISVAHRELFHQIENWKTFAQLYAPIAGLLYDVGQIISHIEEKKGTQESIQLNRGYVKNLIDLKKKISSYQISIPQDFYIFVEDFFTHQQNAPQVEIDSDGVIIQDPKLITFFYDLFNELSKVHFQYLQAFRVILRKEDLKHVLEATPKIEKNTGQFGEIGQWEVDWYTEIGRGGSGTVYPARLKNSGNQDNLGNQDDPDAPYTHVIKVFDTKNRLDVYRAAVREAMTLAIVADMLGEDAITPALEPITIKSQSYLFVRMEEDRIAFIMENVTAKGFIPTKEYFNRLKQMPPDDKRKSIQKVIFDFGNSLTQMLLLYSQRDIKPDNFMIDPQTGKHAFYDVGSSSMAHKQGLKGRDISHGHVHPSLVGQSSDEAGPQSYLEEMQQRYFYPQAKYYLRLLGVEIHSKNRNELLEKFDSLGSEITTKIYQNFSTYRIPQHLLLDYLISNALVEDVEKNPVWDYLATLISQALSALGVPNQYHGVVQEAFGYALGVPKFQKQFHWPSSEYFSYMVSLVLETANTTSD